MNRFTVRQNQRTIVRDAYEKIRSILSGEFLPGYFNRSEVLQAEQAGLSVCDAVLGHVLSATRSDDREQAAHSLLRRVRAALVSDEVENKCHNLHGAVAMMLNQIGCPALSVWGAVSGSARSTKGFVLNPYGPRLFDGHRPGHAWLLTPYWWVADLGLTHQYNVGDDYTTLVGELPSLVVITTREEREPERQWLRLPNEPDSRMSWGEFALATKYHEVIGWSQHTVGRITLRYLPAAVSLPEETELNEINIAVGGKRPGDFFRENMSDLVP